MRHGILDGFLGQKRRQEGEGHRKEVSARGKAASARPVLRDSRTNTALSHHGGRGSRGGLSTVFSTFPSAQTLPST